MFGYEDRRTEQERIRDLEAAEKRRQNDLLALGFMKSCVRPLLAKAGAEVGLAGASYIVGAELLVEVDGVTYRLSARVDNES